jgi:hypothetical protein
MRYLFTSIIIAGLLTIHGCDENDYDPNAKPKESYTKIISKNYSPDKTKLLTLKEHGWIGEGGYTQVLIEFKSTGSGVYAIDTIGVDIKTYWLDNNQIVIETKKAYKGEQRWNQVQSFGDIVKVRYIER